MDEWNDLGQGWPVCRGFMDEWNDLGQGWPVCRGFIANCNAKYEIATQQLNGVFF
jgi:hypothetical protein